MLSAKILGADGYFQSDQFKSHQEICNQILLKFKGTHCRDCSEYDGKQIGLEKVVSLLGIIILGASLGITLLL